MNNLLITNIYAFPVESWKSTGKDAFNLLSLKFLQYLYQKVIWKDGSKTVLLQFKKSHSTFKPEGVKMISFYRWGPKKSTHFSKIIIYLVPEKAGRTNDAQTSTCLISLQHINEKNKIKIWAQSTYKYKAKFLIVTHLLHGKQNCF